MKITCLYPTIDMRRTGENIRRLRMENHITVAELQEFFGFRTPQAIYKWQRGECMPSVDNLLALSRALGVGMDGILVCEGEDARLPKAA